MRRALGRREVHLNGDRTGLLQLRADVPRRRHHADALRGERRHDRQPDAPAGTRDQRRSSGGGPEGAAGGGSGDTFGGGEAEALATRVVDTLLRGFGSPGTPVIA
ncbi:hypothetical protein GCM10027161_78920 [Microbispora hainanensis]